MGLIGILVLLFDQITKYFARIYLKETDGIRIIGDFFRLTYVENRGAAFGILQHQKIFFIITTIVIVGAIIYIKYKYRRVLTKVGNLALYLILSGAVGNLIDRVIFSYVTDFLDFRFGNIYNFPVFNIADISIVIGTVLIICFILSNKEIKKY